MDIESPILNFVEVFSESPEVGSVSFLTKHADNYFEEYNGLPIWCFTSFNVSDGTIARVKTNYGDFLINKNKFCFISPTHLVINGCFTKTGQTDELKNLKKQDFQEIVDTIMSSGKVLGKMKDLTEHVHEKQIFDYLKQHGGNEVEHEDKYFRQGPIWTISKIDSSNAFKTKDKETLIYYAFSHSVSSQYAKDALDTDKLVFKIFESDMPTCWSYGDYERMKAREQTKHKDSIRNYEIEIPTIDFKKSKNPNIFIVDTHLQLKIGGKDNQLQHEKRNQKIN